MGSDTDIETLSPSLQAEHRVDLATPAACDSLDLLERSVAEAASEPLIRVSGAVTEVSPSHARVRGLSPFLKLGECVSFSANGSTHLAEVVRIDAEGASIKAFEANTLTSLGDRVYRAGPLRLFPHQSWKGRVINAFGAPIDAAGPLRPGDESFAVDAAPPPAMRRARISKALRTGIRVVDLFAPICAGQRIGVFAGSGVGKSTLLAMLARSRDFDAVVVALVGERGREVREFLDDALADNRALAVAVVATGDETPTMRRLAPRTAMTIAEFFRDRGDSVLLILDSVTRFAHAERLHRSAEAARARRTRRRPGLDHRRLLGARRRR